MSVCNGRWKPYLPASLRCLQYDKKDPQFCDLLHTLNTVSSELHCEGIGEQHKSAPRAVGKGTAWR